MSDLRARVVVVRSVVVLACGAAVAIACSSSSGDDDASTPPSDASTSDAALDSPTDAGIADAGDPTYVTVAEGTLHGEWAGDAGTSIIRWKGIPFAQPPVGPLRWKAPVYPPADWSGVRDATVYANECLQPPTDTDPTGAISGTEDCLYLNVLANPKSPTPAPVIVFIHGGGFLSGDASNPQFVVAALANRGAVVVTINYRLGALGFLALPALATEDPHHSTGDYGVLDQVAALQWVHDNIAAFGGDPTRVLIWGQSVGSASTVIQMASPLTHGLISSAFAESGVDGAGAAGEPLAKANNAGAAYVNDVGCADAGSVLNCLRALPAAPPDAGGAYAETPAPPGFTWGPAIDGYALPTSIIGSFQAGTQNKIPLMIGTTSAEFGNPVGVRATPTVANVQTPAQYQAALVTNFGVTDAPLVAAQYPVGAAASVTEVQAAYVQVLTDYTFTCSTRRVARAIVGTQTQPVYRYWWTHTLSSGPHASWGPAHATDLPMWFDGFVEGFTPNASELALAHEMSEAVFLFASNGSPNGDAGIAWPQYTAAQESFVDWDDTPKVDAGIRTTLCDFWDAHP